MLFKKYKLLVFSSLFLLLVVNIAPAYRSCTDFRDGFYIGGMVGNSWTDVNVTTQTITSTFGNTKISDLDRKKLLISGHIGYLYVLTGSPIGITPELMFQYSPIKTTVDRSDEGLLFKNKLPWLFGLNARAGFICGNWYLYGILGGKMARINFSAYDKSDGSLVVKDHATALGLTYGSGIETLLWCHHLIRLELVQTRYQSKSFNKMDAAGDVLIDNYKPKMLDLKLGYSILF